MKLLRIVPDDTKYPFMKWRRWSFPFSALISVISVVAFFTLGMNVGIDFRGGSLFEMQAKSGKADIAAIRAQVAGLNIGGAEIQAFGTDADVLVQVELQPDGEIGQKRVVDLMHSTFDKDFEIRRTETVGPRVSGELVRDGTIGVLLALVAITIYLWFRFEWEFAVGAMIATMHDLVLTIGFYAIARLHFDQTSIAAILTIVGYSLNDTVVIYDRIREMMRKYKRMSIGEMMDIAVNATLSRSVVTHVTVLLALIGLVIFGGEVIRGFSLAMLFGVVVGTYSSVFIAAPILIYLGVKVADVKTETVEPPARAKGASAAKAV
ncbi:MAG: protein translocase subunit SecF [Beijerinckiaceae bacterium]|nr:protein translocase subunit SecF [Beijerinckiaceae bacterium]